MAVIEFPLGLIHYRLPSGQVLSECLNWPELFRVVPDRARGKDHLRKLLSEQIPKIATNDLYGKRITRQAEGKWVVVNVDAPRQDVTWKNPVTLRFPVVLWHHPDGPIVVKVRALDVMFFIDPRENLMDSLQREISSTLRRFNHTHSLKTLAATQYADRCMLEWDSMQVDIPSLKQRAQNFAQASDGRKRSILKTIGKLLNPNDCPTAYHLDSTVQQIVETLSANRPQSVLLVGPNGVGKTASFREMVRRRETFGFQATPFYETSGSRLVAGQCGFGMWQERCTEIIREASKQRAILHLGNLIELMEVGKSEHNTTGIAGYLRSNIARGELLCIAECTPEQIHAIERQDPQMVEAFRRITMEEPDRDVGLAILQQYADTPRTDLRPITTEAIRDIDRLHRRYATYSAFPGRPIRFLDNLRRDGSPGQTIQTDDVLQSFARETGLPHVLLDPNVPLDLNQARSWFSKRVIGQREAVDLIVDLLATIKAGLSRPNRPIASLLFIGPTGVGKTEMAKALAEFLFGSKDRLTRFDMSEFGDPISVQRLAGGIFGSEGLLTAKVREQPFSVILLDEFEKAHHSFLDLMLQALGEARLTDAGGRLADFRNAVIILTSNLGAESYQAGKPGFDRGGSIEGEAKEHFVREVEKYLRPEMFNRLDRLVPFVPLDAETIRQIAAREWDKVLQRDGIGEREATMSIDTAAVVNRLAVKGFDARYGARPLKRAIERELLAPIAHGMNRYSAEYPLDFRILLQADQVEVDVKPRLESSRSVSAKSLMPSDLEFAQKVKTLRWQHQLLASSSVCRKLENDLYQLEDAEKKIYARQRRGKPIKGGQQLQLIRLAQVRERMQEITRQRQASFVLEESVLIQIYRKQTPLATDRASLKELDRQMEQLLLVLSSEVNEGSADEIILAISGDSGLWIDALAQAYGELAERLNLSSSVIEMDRLEAPKEIVRLASLQDYPAPEDDSTLLFWYNDYLFGKTSTQLKSLLRRKPCKLDSMRHRDSRVQVLLKLQGPGARIRFLREGGWHHFVMVQGKQSVADLLVEIASGDLMNYSPREELLFNRKIDKGKPIRSYYAASSKVVDPRIDVSEYWPKDLVDPLEKITALHQREILIEIIIQ